MLHGTEYVQQMWTRARKRWALFHLTYKEDLDKQETGANDDAKQEDHCFGRHGVKYVCCGGGKEGSDGRWMGWKNRNKKKREIWWCVMLSSLNTNSKRQLGPWTIESSIEKREIMWLEISSLTGLLSQATADFFQPPLHFFSKWYQFGGARNFICIHGLMMTHPFHPSTHLDANSPWCTLHDRQLHSQPVCTTTERSAATSAPVTVVLVSLDLHDLESGIHSSSGIRRTNSKLFSCHWALQPKLQEWRTRHCVLEEDIIRKKHIHVG